MKKIMILAAAAALYLFSSCQKEEIVSGQEKSTQSDELVFTAVIADQATRTTVNTDSTDKANRGKVSWEVNDSISITDGANTAVYYIADAGDIFGDGSAVFTYKSGDKPSTEAAGYTASYGSAITAVQTYSATVGDLPMTGTSDSGNKTKLNFTVSCGLLKLNLTADGAQTNKTISKIEVVGRLAGASKDTLFTLNCGGESIASAKDFYIALPAGNYTFMRFTNAYGICCKEAGVAMAIEGNKIQPVTLSGLTFGAILPGKFSTSASGKVQFSSGNLYAKKVGSNWSWGFYANQWQYNSLDTVATRIAEEEDTEIDLFCWGYDATGSLGPTEQATRASFADWGQNISTLPGNSVGSKIWKTLSKAEWAYLLNVNNALSGARTDANRFAKARVNNVKGLILFPDGYNDGVAISGVAGVAAVNAATASFPEENVADWPIMESAGCVFLPAAGSRNGQEVNDVGLCGVYWTAPKEGKSTPLTYMQIYGTVAFPMFNVKPSLGCCVRLVCTVLQ